MEIETRSTPCDEFRFWLYSPYLDGLTFFRSAEDRDSFAKEEIDNYLDGEWNEEVESVCAGEVTHIAQQTNRRDKPTDPDELEEANWPHGVDYICEYELLPIAAEKVKP